MAGYVLNDPRPQAKDHPFTFFLPPAEELDHLSPGNLVKLAISADPPSEEYGAERMWVIVTGRDGDRLEGTLDNEPYDIPGLSLGDKISFEIYHVLDIDWEDPDLRARFAARQDEESRFFERCIVDDALIDGSAQVQYLYREDPHSEMSKGVVDTGWCLRADPAFYDPNDPKVSAVAIGVLLNHDPCLLDLIDAPVGSAFERGPDGRFQPVPFLGEEDE